MTDRNRHFAYRLLFLAAAMLLALLFLRLEPSFLARATLPLEDLKFHVREAMGLAPSPPSQVVVIAVDEKSINRLGRWPWDRRLLAALLGRLGEARMVGLDMVFSEPAAAEEDARLAAAIAETGNIILGFFFRSEASVAGTAAELDALVDSAYREVLLPDTPVAIPDYPFAEVNLQAFSQGAAGCASFIIEPDADGVYRRYPLVHLHRGFPFPPLAIQMQRFALNREPLLALAGDGVAEFALGETRIRGASHLRLNYYHPQPELFVSAVDVLEGVVPPEFFQDRLVLIGVTEMGIYDVRPTPLDLVTPGVWLHLTALGNLLQGSHLREAPALDLLVAFSVLTLLTMVSSRRAFGRRLLLYLAILAAVLILANLLFLSRRLWLHEAGILFPAGLLALSLEGFAFLATERQARQLKRAFSSYVSPDVVQELIAHPEKLGLGGVEREVSTLFSDIRGFTTLAEQLPPGQLVRMLSDIHDPLTGVILRRQGMIDKYMGDGMMALFNAPLERAAHADRAVSAALEILQVLATVNGSFRDRGLPEVSVGIGINTGMCVVGNMGSRERFTYTAIGDAVNLAARLEGLCKLYGCPIIISEFTHRRLQEEFVTRRLDRVCVKGKNQSVVIYEVLADTPRNRQIRHRFETALAKYWQGNFAEAGRELAGLAAETGDRPAAVFAERCRHLESAPPGPGWDGIWVLEAK